MPVDARLPTAHVKAKNKMTMNEFTIHVHPITKSDNTGANLLPVRA
jgi:hypothetical protein